jgi:hypothetical protein
MQDLTPNDTPTREEEEAFKELEQALENRKILTQVLENRKIFDNIQPATKEEFMEQATKQESNAQAVATAMDGYIGIGKTAVLETIQGATGAQYVVMDTTPKPEQYAPQPQHTPTVQELAQQLTESFALLIKAITELSNTQPQSQPMSEGLVDAVETVLEQADWFANKVDEKLDELVDDHDFDYEIERAVENHFGDFCLEDHVDVSSEIENIVDDRLDEMVQEKVEEILREKLSTATITFN